MLRTLDSYTFVEGRVANRRTTPLLRLSTQKPMSTNGASSKLKRFPVRISLPTSRGPSEYFAQSESVKSPIRSPHHEVLDISERFAAYVQVSATLNNRLRILTACASKRMTWVTARFQSQWRLPDRCQRKRIVVNGAFVRKAAAGAAGSLQELPSSASSVEPLRINHITAISQRPPHLHGGENLLCARLCRNVGAPILTSIVPKLRRSRNATARRTHPNHQRRDGASSRKRQRITTSSIEIISIRRLRLSALSEKSQRFFGTLNNVAHRSCSTSSDSTPPMPDGLCNRRLTGTAKIRH